MGHPAQKKRPFQGVGPEMLSPGVFLSYYIRMSSGSCKNFQGQSPAPLP